MATSVTTLSALGPRASSTISNGRPSTSRARDSRRRLSASTLKFASAGSVSMVVTMVCRYYGLGPPGSVFFVMAAAIGLVMASAMS